MEPSGQQPAERYERGEQSLSGLSVTELSVHQGPLPHPDLLAGYEEVVPGAAERILSMAESAHRAEVARDLVPIHAEARAFQMATFGVTFLPWILIAACLALLAGGQDAAAAIAGITGAVGGGAQIIQATRSRGK